MTEDIVVVISGQVSAGKTTAAKMLRSHGFQYARISQAIKTRWKGPKDKKPPRSWYQEMGMHLHRTIGQSALCAETLALIPNPSTSFVIDGARWNEDVQFFKDRYAATCLHIHLTAPTQIRRERFEKREKDISFEEADRHEVEQGVAELAEGAHAVFDNSTDDETRLGDFLVSTLEGFPNAR